MNFHANELNISNIIH